MNGVKAVNVFSIFLWLFYAFETTNRITLNTPIPYFAHYHRSLDLKDCQYLCNISIFFCLTKRFEKFHCNWYQFNRKINIAIKLCDLCVSSTQVLFLTSDEIKIFFAHFMKLCCCCCCFLQVHYQLCVYYYFVCYLHGTSNPNTHTRFRIFSEKKYTIVIGRCV